MEGQGQIEEEDKMGISDKFKMMPAGDMPLTNRVTGKWYSAIPPLCRDDNFISPCDYFGRTLVENPPE